MAEFDERVEELGSLEAIYPEIRIDHETCFATLELAVTPSTPLLVRFVPDKSPTAASPTYAQATVNAHVEHDVKLSHLPSLILQVLLPPSYPVDAPPKVLLSADHAWLRKEKLDELEVEAAKVWEEYGRCQILFAYIDFLQQAAERAFDIDQSAEGCLVLPASAEKTLVAFDEATELAVFNTGHYDCGICLEPKKGLACYKMKRCGHVFCLQCLQDFYNNAIMEGDVAVIRCLDPTCGVDPSGKKKRKRERTLHPRELLAMRIEEPVVRRYVEMKRKKKLEADKNTVWCPRTWCQGPAKSANYVPLPTDLTEYIASDDENSDNDAETRHDSTATTPPKKDPASGLDVDRLAVCEKCSLAFCRVCYMGWHGPFIRCFPRNAGDLTVEERASYNYIRRHTSPCPSCGSPTQKIHGCNHMTCFQCGSHFCYLCGAWLNKENPYIHFNTTGRECYQRLFDLEQGDEAAELLQGEEGREAGERFGGIRRFEMMALEVAREADERELAEMAGEDGEGEVDEATQRQRELRAAAWDVVVAEPIVVGLAQVQLNPPPQAPDPQPQPQPQARAPPPQRARRNPFPVRPGVGGAADAVRRHERAAAALPPRRRQAPHAALDDDDRFRGEIQRFLRMARDDTEDAWDSDELDEDDGRLQR
ncbi:hypothetical protein LTR78_010748 [Recurvomyces mirabilis]|uniref:RBR-type E3 ubiquitin transferase n=1 Tax=Recurvomyces mirabilis TaxID=574656 RepID=A0AAE0TMD9_9PEZI|nr:hypothetical protein LTR78_010748 [Recurvomyces mirabilis]KAK5155585.1 hypothetical protein LTS14_005846 [Recurvomyces mirabilis]